MRNFRILTMVLVWLFAIPVFSQGRGGNASSQQTTQKGKQYPPGSAWTLTYPLGSHQTSTIDTLVHNFQKQFVPALNSDAWAGTGTYGGEGLNMLYFNRPQGSAFFMEDALSHYIPRFRKEKFYNVYVPMTLVTYAFSGGQENRLDDLKTVFAGNINKNAGVGANLDFIYNKGEYNSTGLKNLMFGGEGYYTGERYEMQVFANHYHNVNQENGGITDDLYITDPAQLQGGVATIQPKSIPTRLNGAQTRLIGAEVFMTHAYKIGYWRDDTQEGDTVEKKTLIPVTKFIYSFDYRFNQHEFKNTRGAEAKNFWNNTYFNAERTFDTQDYFSVTNTLGVSMIEGFHTWAKFGLSAYASHEYDRFKFGYLLPGQSDPVLKRPTRAEVTGLTPLPEGYVDNLRHSRNRVWIGGRLEKTKGTLLRYSANARFGMLGDALGDVDVDGIAETRFLLGGDTVRISANGWLKNQTPSYLLRNYVSNHFIWNNDFGKQRSVRVGGNLFIPWLNLNLGAGVENVQNLVYFNSKCVPEQHSGNIQIVAGTADHHFRRGIWNWDNRITLQGSSNESVVPLPSFALYSNMYLGFTAFNVLHAQVGVDCNYYSKYRGMEYQPATMSFHVQGEDPVYVGNFPLMNAYFTAKLSKTRFFVMWSHFNQGLFGGSNYFSMPHYPIDPSRVRFGLSVDFAD